MGASSIDPLRVLVADERADRLDQIAAVLRVLGHEVVAALTHIADLARAIRLERPDVAIVGVGQDKPHALALISEIVHHAACPVIVDIDAEDPAFVDDAATRGVFAYVRDGGRDQIQSALGIVLRRYAEFTRVHGALGRQAIIEQAKGILMERHGLSARDAFESLRQHARNTNQTVYDVAEAVTLSYSLFRSPPAGED
ncbi:MAG: ANTAR domain-containing response regulator [Solirubrobacteraceae bacterium]|jgi:AmiR/NasT family two-component response regulator